MRRQTYQHMNHAAGWEKRIPTSDHTVKYKE